MHVRALLLCLGLAAGVSVSSAALAVDPPRGLPAAGAPGKTAGVELADVAPPPLEEVEPPSSVGNPSSIDGHWRVGPDGVAEVVLLRGEYEAHANGQLHDSGTFTLDGDAASFQSDGGAGYRGQITREGDLMLFEEDGGGLIVLLHAEPPVVNGPAALTAFPEGRWFSHRGGHIDLFGGLATFGGVPDQPQGSGSYRFDGGQLVLVRDGVSEVRGPLFRVGDRLVVEMPGNGEVLVLTPESGTAADLAFEEADAPTPLPSDEDLAASPLDGRWRAGADLVVEFAGTRFQVDATDGPAPSVSGTLRLEGDRFWMRADGDTEERTGRFAVEGDLLLFEPDGDLPAQLLRAETPRGTATAAGAADLVGRWRVGGDDVVDFLADGRFIAQRDDSRDEGTYTVEGDVLIIMKRPDDDGDRLRWGRIGERVVLERTYDDVTVLTPEPAAEESEAPPTTDPAGSSSSGDIPGVGPTSIVDGRWIAGPIVAEFAGGRFTVVVAGEQGRSGSFAVEGSALLLIDDLRGPDVVTRAPYWLAGDALLVEAGNDPAVMLLAETPRGTPAALAPEDIEGRWRTSEGDVVELRGGRYASFDDAGSVRREDGYSIAGDTITIAMEDGPETWRWARFGERIALLKVGDHKTIVLTPLPAADEAAPPSTDRHRTKGRG